MMFAIVFVAVSGKLVQQGAELGTDEYCLAENWETSSSEAHDGSILALSCDQCMDNVGGSVITFHVS